MKVISSDIKFDTPKSTDTTGTYSDMKVVNLIIWPLFQFQKKEKKKIESSISSHILIIHINKIFIIKFFS